MVFNGLGWMRSGVVTVDLPEGNLYGYTVSDAVGKSRSPASSRARGVVLKSAERPIRPAATVVLLRDSAGGPEVLQPRRVPVPAPRPGEVLVKVANGGKPAALGVRIAGDMRLNGDSIYHRSVDVIELRKRMGMVFERTSCM